MEKNYFYEAPDVELIELRFEDALLVTSAGGPGDDDTTVDLGDLD